MAEFIDIVLHASDEFDGEEFVEIEAPFGRSIRIGESIEKSKGFRHIRIKPEDIENA